MIENKFNINWGQLSFRAWKVRENAFIYGNTMVGASLITASNNIYVGCNVEHKYRSHDIHAEVNAIGNMVSKGDSKIMAILIVAERDLFTPCGSCMDWIMQFCDVDCIVGFQNQIDGEIIKYTVNELMPYYPR